VATIFKEADVNSVKFGLINVTRNSIVPRRVGGLPHIEIFRAGNESDARPYFGRGSLESVIRFVKKYASGEVAVEVAPETVVELKEQMADMKKVWLPLAPGDREAVAARMEEVRELLSKGQI
jgi:hypothetical protein